MTHESGRKNSSGYTVQTAIALILFILGLMLLVVWAILYANRLSNNLTPEWWIWFFLGFGVGLMIIGLIWLIIVQYMVGSKANEMYEELCRMDRSHHLEHERAMEHARAMESPRSSSGVPRRSTVGSFAHND